MIKLKYCPAEYYHNCYNAIKKCHKCGAARGAAFPLAYLPIEPILLEHPYGPDKHRSAVVKESLKAEKKSVQKLIRTTQRSGAVNHDGDINFNGLRLEHKVRHTSNGESGIGITKAERRKGREQAIDGWVLLDKYNQEHFYLLTQKGLDYIMGGIKLSD